MDIGGRAPTVGDLGDAWSSCTEGQGEEGGIGAIPIKKGWQTT